MPGQLPVRRLKTPFSCRMRASISRNHGINWFSLLSRNTKPWKASSTSLILPSSDATFLGRRYYPETASVNVTSSMRIIGAMS